MLHLKPGSRVKARFQGGKTRYPGTIRRVNSDGTYAIEYDDGDREDHARPEWIESNMNESSNSKQRGFVQRSPQQQRRQMFGEGDDLEEESLDAPPRRNRSPNREQQRSRTNGNNQFLAGDRVVAYFRGNKKNGQYPGQIVSVRTNGTVDILYDDGDKDSGLDPRLVSKMDSSTNKQQASNNSNDKGNKYIVKLKQKWVNAISQLEKGTKLYKFDDMNDSRVTCTFVAARPNGTCSVKLRDGSRSNIKSCELATHDEPQRRLLDPRDIQALGDWFSAKLRAKMSRDNQTLVVNTDRFVSLLQDELGMGMSEQAVNSIIQQCEIRPGSFNLTLFIQCIQTGSQHEDSDIPSDEEDLNTRKSKRAVGRSNKNDDSELSDIEYESTSSTSGHVTKLRNWFDEHENQIVDILRAISVELQDTSNLVHELSNLEVDSMNEVLASFDFPTSKRMTNAIQLAFGVGTQRRNQNRINFLSFLCFGCLKRKISTQNFRSISKLATSCFGSHKKANKGSSLLQVLLKSKRKQPQLEDMFDSINVQLDHTEADALKQISKSSNNSSCIAVLALFAASKQHSQFFGFKKLSQLGEEQYSMQVSKTLKKLPAAQGNGKQTTVPYSQFAKQVLMLSWNGHGPWVNGIDVAKIALECFATSSSDESDTEDEMIKISTFQTLLLNFTNNDESGNSEVDEEQGSGEDEELSFTEFIETLRECFQTDESSPIQAVHQYFKTTKDSIPSNTFNKKLLKSKSLKSYQNEVNFLTLGMSVNDKVDVETFAKYICSKPMESSVYNELQNASHLISRQALRNKQSWLFDTRIPIEKRVLKGHKALGTRATSKAVAKELEKYAGKEHKLLEKLQSRLKATTNHDLYKILKASDKTSLSLCTRKQLEAAFKKCGCNLSKKQLTSIEDFYTVGEKAQSGASIFYPNLVTVASGVCSSYRQQVLSEIGYITSLLKKKQVDVNGLLQRTDRRGKGELKLNQFQDAIHSQVALLSCEQAIVIGTQVTSSFANEDDYNESLAVDLSVFDDALSTIIKLGEKRSKHKDNSGSGSSSESDAQMSGESESDSDYESSNTKRNKKKPVEEGNGTAKRVSAWFSKFRKRDGQQEEIDRSDASDISNSESDPEEDGRKNSKLAAHGYIPISLGNEIKKKTNSALQRNNDAAFQFLDMCSKADRKSVGTVSSKVFSNILRKVGVTFNKQDHQRITELFKFGSDEVGYTEFLEYAFSKYSRDDLKLLDKLRCEVRSKFGFDALNVKVIRKEIQESGVKIKQGSIPSKVFATKVLSALGVKHLSRNEIRTFYELMDTDAHDNIQLDRFIDLLNPKLAGNVSRTTQVLRNTLGTLHKQRYKFDSAFQEVCSEESGEEDCIDMKGFRKLFQLLGLPVTEAQFCLVADNLDLSDGSWEQFDFGALNSFKKGRGKLSSFQDRNAKNNDSSSNEDSEEELGNSSDDSEFTSKSSKKKSKSRKKNRNEYNSSDDSGSSSDDFQSRKSKGKKKSKRSYSSDEDEQSDEVWSDEQSDVSDWSNSSPNGDSDGSWDSRQSSSQEEESRSEDSDEEDSRNKGSNGSMNAKDVKTLKDYLRLGFNVLDTNKSGKLNGWDTRRLLNECGIIVKTQDLVNLLPNSSRRNNKKVGSPKRSNNDRRGSGIMMIPVEQSVQENEVLDEAKVSRSIMNKIAIRIIQGKHHTLGIGQKETLFGMFHQQNENRGMICSRSMFCKQLSEGLNVSDQPLWFTLIKREVNGLLTLLDPKHKGYVSLTQFIRCLYNCSTKKSLKQAFRHVKNTKGGMKALSVVYTCLKQKILKVQLRNPVESLKSLSGVPSSMTSGWFASIPKSEKISWSIDTFLPYCATSNNNDANKSLQVEFNLRNASGIPPLPDGFSKENVLSRRARVRLAWKHEVIGETGNIDDELMQELCSARLNPSCFIGNEHIIEAGWDRSEEDVWKFGTNQRKSTKPESFVLHLNNELIGFVDSLCLVIELCVVVSHENHSRGKRDKVDIEKTELSSGWCAIELTRKRKERHSSHDESGLPTLGAIESLNSGSHCAILLAAGTPSCSGAFRRSDLRARRSGWRALTNTLQGKSNDGNLDVGDISKGQGLPQISIRVGECKSLNSSSKTFVQSFPDAFVLPVSAVPFLETYQDLLVLVGGLGASNQGDVAVSCLKLFVEILWDGNLLGEFMSRFHGNQRGLQQRGSGIVENPFYAAVTSMIPLLTQAKQDFDVQLGRKSGDAELALCGNIDSGQEQLAYRPFTISELMM